VTLVLMVLFGGPGPEHAISCESARSVLRALNPRRYEVVPVYVSRSGEWFHAPQELPALGYGVDAWNSFAEDTACGTTVELVGTSLRTADGSRVVANLDLAFSVIHGQYGEDGTIQTILESHGVRYVGSGVRACGDSFDKDLAKRIVKGAGVTVGSYAVIDGGLIVGADLRQISLPAFVKPARCGSSLGITRITSWGQLETALATAADFDVKVLVEQAIPGRELSVGVLEGDLGCPPIASSVSEALFAGHSWYDYTAKYLDPTCEMRYPVGVSDPDIERLREAARLVFSALGCEGLARIDFFYDSTRKIVFNEVNTMPGMATLSLFPDMWFRSGLSYESLLDKLVLDAWHKPFRRHDPTALSARVTASRAQPHASETPAPP
jgi:D-alanine-D-alanine ligase